MKKKVIHVLSSDKYSGAENVATYIVQVTNDNYQSVYASPKGSITESLKLRGIKYLPMNDFSVSEIKKVIHDYKPDIIHAHDFTATIKCILANSKLPIVSHIHQNPTWIKKINKNSLIWYLLSSKVNKVIVVTPSILESMKKYKKLRNKIVVIENIVDVNEVRRKAISEIKEGYDLLFVGRLVDVKNPIRFIDITSKLINDNKDLKVGIIGDGNLKYECESIIKDLNLEKNLTLKGFVSNPFPILNNSKILVITSKSEGLPMTAIEAIALGKPVVSSNIDGIDKVIDKSWGTICDNDYDYITNLKKLLYDRDEYSKISKLAEEKANRMFNTLEYKNKIIEVYNCVKQ